MIETIKEIAREAGKKILGFYGDDIAVKAKADQSPLTLADEAAHHYICDALARLGPDIPVLSEESSETDIANRKSWSKFWLVDPLDGTKEFIKKTGEFTVNIALIEGQIPVLGVIYVPAQDLFYYAQSKLGAWKQEHGADPVAIVCRPPKQEQLAIVASRDHAGPEVKSLLERFPTAEAKSMGSSLKFCLVAEGQADIYLRDVPTMEWDTAAAQCIVETAGGVVTLLDGTALTYNKDDLRNPPVVTLGESNFAWR